MELELSQLECRYESLRIADEGRHQKLVSSLLVHGQRHPVLVVAGEHEGSYLLIDGYARVRALRELMREEVEACELALGAAEALLLAHGLPSARARTALEEGWLLRELIEAHGCDLRELALGLDRSVSWVSRRLALVRALPEKVQEAVRRGRIGAQAATKVLVPLARANGSDCESLVAALGTGGISVRQLEAWYLAYKRGDEGQREHLVREPRLFLRAFGESEASPRTPEPSESDLTRDLDFLVTLSRRVRRRVRAGECERLGLGERAVIAGLWGEARGVLISLMALMKRKLEDDRSRDAGGDPAPPPRGALDPGHCPDHRALPEQRA
jgi:ParB/RepB/Spo0J family partition protein